LLVTFLRSITAILFWTAVRDRSSVLDCVYFRDCAVIPRVVGDCGSDLKFFSGLWFHTAFIFETTVGNRSSVRNYTGLKFETAFLFDSRNLCVNHLCIATPRIVYDSICNTKLVIETSNCFVTSKATRTVTRYRGLRAHCIRESTINIVSVYNVLSLKH